MKTPVRFHRGKLSYTGQLARAEFIAWAASPEGRPFVERHASQIRLALFGRTRTARARVWRSVIQAANHPRVVSGVQQELDSFLTYLEPLVYAPDLPRLTVDLRRLVVVPRLLLNGELYQRLDMRLQAEPLFGVGQHDLPLRDWFMLTIIRAVELALAREKPSPARPMAAADEWICVGLNDTFEWRPPFDGHAWRGHFYLLELRSTAITRAVRAASSQAIAELEDGLHSLSGLQRTAILRAGAAALAQNESQTTRRTGT